MCASPVLPAVIKPDRTAHMKSHTKRPLIENLWVVRNIISHITSAVRRLDMSNVTLRGTTEQKHKHTQ